MEAVQNSETAIVTNNVKVFTMSQNLKVKRPRMSFKFRFYSLVQVLQVFLITKFYHLIKSTKLNMNKRIKPPVLIKISLKKHNVQPH